MAAVISFTTDRFDDITAEMPNPINPIPGQSVLLWLREELTRAQYRVTEPDTEDWGWYMQVEGEGGYYMVGASADAADPAPPVGWIVQVHKDRSMKGRVLGRGRMAPGESLVTLIARIVRADGRLQNVSVSEDD